MLFKEFMRKNETPREIVLLCGPQCSGKSTWLKKNKKAYYKVLSRDGIIMKKAARMGVTNYEKAFDSVPAKEVDSELYNRLKQLTDAGRGVYIDMMSLTSKSRAKILDKVPDDYKKVAVVFDTPLQTLLKRNEARSKEEDKYLPPGVIVNSFKRLEYPSKTEGFTTISKA